MKKDKAFFEPYLFILFLLSQFFSKLDEVILQIIFDLWVFEGVVDGCFHEAKLVSDIVTSPIELTSKYTLCFIEGVDCICQLNFISCTWSLVFEDLENFRREEVASDNSKVARSVLWSWFFNKGFNTVKTIFPSPCGAITP